MSTETANVYTLNDLEHALVASAIADTEILETVAARYGSRLTGRLRSLFDAANTYFSFTRGLLTRDALAQILANSEPDTTKHQDYLSLYDALTGPPYSDYTSENRRWFVHQFDVEWKREQTGNILAQAAEAMRTGHKAHGETLTGAEAAWQVLQEQRLKFENFTSGNTLHEAEFTTTVDKAKQDYIRAQEAEIQGTPFALPELNSYLPGLMVGRMHFVTAYAGEGKSFMMINDAHSAWKAGHNVACATGEMTVNEYRSRFIACHSKYLADEGKIPYGIETIPIERGELTKEQHDVWLTVLEDIKQNTDYGKFFCFSFPYRATPTLIFNRFSSYDQVVPLSMVVVDYLGLMSSDQPRVSRREELDDLIRQTKALALSFRGGEGVGLEVGYQVNRASFERARQDGYYTLSCFAESSEAEKSADSAVWLLSIPQNPDEIRLGLIKNRGGTLGEALYARRNFQYAQIASLHRTSSSPSAPAAPASQVSSLLDIG